MAMRFLRPPAAGAAAGVADAAGVGLAEVCALEGTTKKVAPTKSESRTRRIRVISLSPCELKTFERRLTPAAEHTPRAAAAVSKTARQPPEALGVFAAAIWYTYFAQEQA